MTEEGHGASAYAASGVDTTEKFDSSLGSLLEATNATFAYQKTFPPVLENGYFANVVKMSNELGVAISTDGVGTKLLVAELAERYDTVGIDLIAMNANDVLCVGARPTALVDYIAVQGLDRDFLAQIGEGLRRGAEQAEISIPAGEIAQVPEMIRGINEGSAFDLVGTCIGVVALDKIILGERVVPGDVVIGLPASGIHSNGYTLARRTLLQGDVDAQRVRLSQNNEKIGRTLADELLEPTKIYVKEVMALIDAGLDIRALAHITGDGLLNLTRIRNDNIGFVFDQLPTPPPIYSLIAEEGGVDASEMYTVFNMGIGFCVVLPGDQAERAMSILRDLGDQATTRHGAPAVLGRAVEDPRKRVRLIPNKLIGEGKGFQPDRD